eukprot:7117239-Prymnesium_polylepis.1
MKVLVDATAQKLATKASAVMTDVAKKKQQKSQRARGAPSTWGGCAMDEAMDEHGEICEARSTRKAAESKAREERRAEKAAKAAAKKDADDAKEHAARVQALQRLVSKARSEHWGA